MREIVGDYIGALEDLREGNLASEYRLERARVLARLGFGDLAIEEIRRALGRGGERSEPPPSAAVGIAGRRFDLRLLGFRSTRSEPGVQMQPWQRGAVAEHMITLGEFSTARELRRRWGTRGYPLLAAVDDIASADVVSTLRSRIPASRVSQAIEGVRGWLSLDEAKLLGELAADVAAPNPIVEVGSFAGRSTCALAVGSTWGSSPLVHSVDPHSGVSGMFKGSTLQLFRENLRSKGLDDTIVSHVSPSSKVASEWRGEDVGMLFIDGNHEYESVKEDFELWLPHLAEGGYVAFHDSNQQGPNMLLRQVIGTDKHLRPLGLRDTLFVLRKSSGQLRPSHRATWQLYLEILSRHFESWMSVERERLRKAASVAFESLDPRREAAETSKDPEERKKCDEGRGRQHS